MYKVAIVGSLQQQAEALGTQFPPISALYNRESWNTNLSEMISSDRVTYRPYAAVGSKQERAEVLRLIHEISPDIIYMNGVRQLLDIGSAIRTSRALGPRPLLIATSHNSRVWASAHKRMLMALLFHTMADGVLTLAKFQEQWLRKYGVPTRKMRTIANPVDVNRFRPGQTNSRPRRGRPVLLNVGGLSPLKNQAVLIEALTLVRKQFPAVQLVLTGGRNTYPAYASYLADLIASRDLQSNVVNVGYQEHSQIPQLYQACDVSLFSSVSEVCPFVVLESLATGKATIATRVGGIPDLIQDGFNGLLVDANDSSGFAAGILRLLGDGHFQRAMEANARATAVFSFSYEAIGMRHAEFIRTLTGGGHRRSAIRPEGASE